jgi:hypothetical protein
MTSEIASTTVIVSSGAVSGEGDSQTSSGRPISAWVSNITSLFGTSVGVIVSSGAAIGEIILCTGKGGPIPLAPTPVLNSTQWFGEMASSTTISSETSEAWSGSTRSSGPIPAPTGNFSISESVTNIISLVSSAISGLVTGGNSGGGLISFPNATILEILTSCPLEFARSNATVIVNSIITMLSPQWLADTVRAIQAVL